MAEPDDSSTMKALTQNYRNGDLSVADVPPPALRPGGILVHNTVSLVSAGTERLMIELAQKGLVGKARERPDLVRQVVEKARKGGVRSTLEAVWRRLDTPIPLGYSSAGTVIAVGEGVDLFQPADRVACAGAGFASHAEVVFVPRNLAVQLPDEVDFESAAFTTLGAVAIQGLRLADVQLGETVVVIGLGVVGLLAVQLARLAGCSVLAMDPNPDRCQQAERLGCDLTATESSQFTVRASDFTGGLGADAVVIAAATKSSEPVSVAGEVARDQAKVVVIGSVGMDIPRDLYYQKELTLRVSRSYGPGRYDLKYEEKGHDYPIGYVRWTANRNMQAFVRQLANGKMNVKPLITHRFPIEKAPWAYELITSKADEPSLGILLTYPDAPDSQSSTALPRRIDLGRIAAPSLKGAAVAGRRLPVTVGFLGAGQFATATLLPAMKRIPDVEFIGVCTATGISGSHVARKFGFRYATTDENEILSDPDINTVVIATRHHLHARQVIAALNASKHVFCEKPLCLNEQELDSIVRGYSPLTPRHGPLLMVGYNRRFAPLARRLKDFLSQVKEPLVMHYRVNAGYIPLDHWVHDLEQGGGRIIGEVCHFVDFLTFLAGASPTRVSARALPNSGRYRDDNVVITLDFADGSIGTITYVANGDKSYPKERVEVFGGATVAVLDNFRRLELIRDGRRRVVRSRLAQDKGHRGEWEAFVGNIHSDREAPIPFEEIVYVTLCTFSIFKALRDGRPTGVRITLQED